MKSKLKLETFKVESFQTTPVVVGRGTVHGASESAFATTTALPVTTALSGPQPVGSVNVDCMQMPETIGGCIPPVE